MKQFKLYSDNGNLLAFFMSDNINESRAYFKQLFPKLTNGVIMCVSDNNANDF